MNNNNNIYFLNNYLQPFNYWVAIEHLKTLCVNSPDCTVSSGSDGLQSRVPIGNVPRRFLDLQSVKPGSDGGILQWRLHADVLFQCPVGVSGTKRFHGATGEKDLAVKVRTRRKRPRLSTARPSSREDPRHHTPFEHKSLSCVILLMFPF